MKRLLLVGSVWALCSSTSFAQSGQLPPVYFNAGKYLCEDGSWKLVFQDHFDGAALQAPWITFNSYSGMAGDDNPNWKQGRTAFPFNCIYLDKNIYLSDGTVKLMVFKENATFDTLGGPWLLSQYTTSTISLPYTIGGQPKGFNAGRFEARIKMPTFLHAHSTMWLWNGNGVNEIDIAEAYGKGKNGGLFGDYPKCNYSTHSHPPGGANPYGLGHYEWGAHHYPNLTWWDWVKGNAMNINDWHTYTCEWDSTVVRFYLDGNKINEVWKYYMPLLVFGKEFKMAINCVVPGSGNYKVTPGFPYEPNSNSQLRFTTWVDKQQKAGEPGYIGSHESKHPNGYLGEMEIDYVKIWQRRLENGWTDIEAPPTLTINGPNIVCNTATFTAVNPTATGYWAVNGDNLQILSSNNSSVTVKVINQNRTVGAILYYPNNGTLYPPLAGEMPYFVSKTFDAGVAAASKAIISQTASSATGTVKFNMGVKGGYPFGTTYKFANYQSPVTFHWSVDYGPSSEHHFETDGQFITTPDIPYVWGATNYLNWTVTITNACGSVTLNGSETFANKPSMSRSAQQGHVIVMANITDETGYQDAVQSRLSSKFFPENADNLTIQSGIAEIELEELAPYIIWDSTQTQQPQQRGIAPGTEQEETPTAIETQLFPNPATGLVHLLPGSKFSDKQVISFTLHDQLGRLAFSRDLDFQPGTIVSVDVSRLPAGLYIATMKQQGTAERIRLMIQAK